MFSLVTLISLLIFKISAYQDGSTYNLRDSYNRENADALFGGFFPQWGVVLLILSGFFLVISGFALIGYFMGCRTPIKHHQPSTDSTVPFCVIQNLVRPSKLSDIDL